MRSFEFLCLSLTLGLSAVEGRLFGWLHGGRESTGDGPGVFLSDTELRDGRRALSCLQYAANVEGDPFGDLGMMIGPMSRALLNNFGLEGIDMLCGSSFKGRKLLAEENGEEFDESMETSSQATYVESKERRTTTCPESSAIYPNNPLADPSGMYTNYANQKYQQYVINGDLSNRSHNPTVIEKLNQEINYLQKVKMGLDSCSSLWSTINNAIGIADVPGVDIENISEAMLAFSCMLANDYNDIVISRKERDVERLIYHDQAIDNAEVKAAFENTKNIMSNVCDLSASMNIMDLEMQVLDAST